VIICEHESDARRIFEVLPSRFHEHGLELHPDKTRLIPFRRPRRANDTQSWDFLGFTHYWSRSHKGYWVVKRKTMRKRLARALSRIDDWCRMNRHAPVRYQHRRLSQAVRGHCGYYGITGNSLSLVLFREGLRKIWRKWLKRRSHAKRQGREWWDALCKRYPILSPTRFTPSCAPRNEPMPLRSRMRELRTSGSVGGQGRERPWSTRWFR